MSRFIKHGALRAFRRSPNDLDVSTLGSGESGTGPELVLLSVTHATPGLQLPASGPAGVKLVDLEPGDLVSFGAGFETFSFASIPTVWNGTTPFLHIVGSDANRGDLPGTPPADLDTSSVFLDLTSVDDDFNVDGSVFDNAAWPSLHAGPLIVRAATSWYVYVDDGSGGNPGSTQGELLLGLCVWRGAFTP